MDGGGPGQDGVQVKVQEEVGRAAEWGKSALSGKWERVGEVSAVHCGGRNSSAGRCELISSHCLPQCLRASGSGKSEPGAPQRPPPSPLPHSHIQSGSQVPLLPPYIDSPFVLQGEDPRTRVAASLGPLELQGRGR